MAGSQQIEFLYPRYCSDAPSHIALVKNVLFISLLGAQGHEEILLNFLVGKTLVNQDEYFTFALAHARIKTGVFGGHCACTRRTVEG